MSAPQASLQQRLERFYMPVFCVFLVLIFAMDKGFTYARLWVGDTPVFVTEVFLLFSVLVWIALSVAQRKPAIPRDPIFLIFFGLFVLSGTCALLRISYSDHGLVLSAFKRSALFYYSAFCFLFYAILYKRESIETVFNWVMIGGLIAALQNTAEFFDVLPYFWPETVGIANDTAKMVGALYVLFGLRAEKRRPVIAAAGAFMLCMVLMTTRRSALIATLVVLATFLVTLFFRVPGRADRKWQIKVLLLAALFMVPLVAVRGIPLGLARFGFLKGFFMKQVPPPAPPAPEGESVLPKPAEKAVVTENKPVMPAPVAPWPGEAVKPPIPDTYVVKSPALKRKLALDNRESSRGTIEKTIDRVLTTESGGGNASWRKMIWIEAIRDRLQTDFFIGAGFFDPLVMLSVCPYKSPERIDAAIAFLDAKTNFYQRMKNPEIDPVLAVDHSVPMGVVKGEGLSYASVYWYDIDLHNSHVAIFYRLGFIGLLGHLGLWVTALVRIRRKIAAGDEMARFMALGLLWYTTAAFFNVVLEGPFMGAVYWMLLGTIFSLTRRTNDDLQTH